MADQSISEKVERVDSILETLERGEVSLEQATQLREEGQGLSAELQSDLDVGNGSVLERD